LIRPVTLVAILPLLSGCEGILGLGDLHARGASVVPDDAGDDAGDDTTEDAGPGVASEAAPVEGAVEVVLIEAEADAAMPVEGAAAPMEASAVVEAGAPAEAGAPSEAGAPTEASTPMEASAPMEATTPMEARAPEASMPVEASAPVPELPGAFILGAPTPTPTRGVAGTPTTVLCPTNQVVTGYKASVNSGNGLVSSLQLVCSRIDVIAPAPYALAWSAGATLPVQGSPSSPIVTAACPPGQCVVGIVGQSGLFIDQVGFECAPMTRQADGTVTVSSAAPTVLQAVGGNGGSPFDDVCPTGQVVRGATTSAGAWLDSVSAVCAPAAAPPCVQDLSGVSTGTFRVSFTVQTSQAGWVALINQRGDCNTGVPFWQVRLSDGNVVVETDDARGHYARVASAGAAVNDGLPHVVLVQRVQGTLSVTIDGAVVASGASASDLTALPPLEVRQDPCTRVDGTVPLVGTITNVCVTAR
jgi:hypothetical protein